MIKIFKQYYFIVFISISSVYASTEVTSWAIDLQKSEIVFTATVNNAPIQGKFKNFTGDINFDTQKLNNSSVKIIIDMGSVFATYSDIAPTLKKEEWFDIKDYPQAIFTSNTFVKGVMEGIYQANGMLTIRDKSFPVTLTFSFQEYTKTNAIVNGSTTFNRSSFDVGTGEWVSTDVVKDSVKVDFKITATAVEHK